MTSSKKDITISLFLLVALVAFPQLSESIYSPALPTIAKELSTTPFLVELSLSIYFVGFALGTALWGYFSDLWGRRPCMLLGLAIYGISCALLSTSETISTVLALRVLQAFGASVGSVITLTILRDILEGEARHKAFSIISMSIAFAPAIGPFLGGSLCSLFSWRATFTFLLMLAIVLFAICMRQLRETRPATCSAHSRPSFFRTGKAMLKDTPILGHVLFITSCNGIIFGFFAEGPFLTINILKMTAYQYSLFGLLISAGTLISASFSYRLQGKRTPEQIINYGVGIAALGTCILLSMAFYTQNILGLILGLFLTFFGAGLIIPNSLSIALQNYQTVAGTAGAIFGLLYYIGIAAMVGLVSWMHNGTALTLPIYFLIQVTTLFCGTRLIRKERQLVQFKSAARL